MGGRNAASGTGKHPYGSEYKTVLQDGNIKFVKYRLAGKGKRSKTIDLLHAHNGKSPHSHTGYEHDGKAADLTDEEKKLLARVRKAWYDSKGK